MSRTAWITAIIAAIVIAGAAFWGGMAYSQNKTGSSASKFTGAGGASFAGRTGAAGFTAGGGTVGTVVATGSGTFTIQLPSSTSTTASTGTKLVLVDNATEIDELESVPASNIAVGQSVTVAGATNSDGSVTATSVMIRPAATRTGAAGSTGATTQANTQ